MKRAGSQGECALIRVRGLWRCALFCALSKHDRRLVTEPVNDTKLASLSVMRFDLANPTFRASTDALMCIFFCCFSPFILLFSLNNFISEIL